MNFWRFLEIFDAIIEGQAFESSGFELNLVIRMAIMRKVSQFDAERSDRPQSLRCLFSQEALFLDVEMVSKMIADYNTVVNSLSVAEVTTCLPIWFVEIYMIF